MPVLVPAATCQFCSGKVFGHSHGFALCERHWKQAKAKG